MKNLFLFGAICALSFSCSPTDVVPASITDEPPGGYYIVIEGDTLRPSITTGWQSDTTIGYEFTWDFTNEKNPSIPLYKKLSLSIFVYDEDVNPQAMNTLKDSYPITVYNNTSSNSSYEGKCGIKLTYSTNSNVDSIFTSSVSNGTLYCGFSNPFEILKVNTTIQGKSINIHQNY